MKSERLEAFTDGVVAIIITIMVLELHVPESASLAALRAAVPVLLAYVLSYVNVGLYWNNHHHLLQATEHIDGRVLWANLFLLFWLSLVPFVIRWIDAAGVVPLPVAAYGFVLGMAALGYLLMERAIIAVNGRDSTLAQALGRDRKGKLSIAAYLVATPISFLSPAVAILLYIAVIAVWLIPDRRIERKLLEEEEATN
ncbi:MAG: DUF1211 domain-containing protein [Sphingomonadaceae bacterium]|nr:DUF1211 domain-containing protein [Sphingomonadaceae bacterium]